METKNRCIEKQREVDIINEKIILLQKTKQKKELEISLLKKDIIKENIHFVGKEAICETANGKEVISKCDSVICSDSFDPFFIFKTFNKDRLIFLRWK